MKHEWNIADLQESVPSVICSTSITVTAKEDTCFTNRQIDETSSKNKDASLSTVIPKAKRCLTFDKASPALSVRVGDF